MPKNACALPSLTPEVLQQHLSYGASTWTKGYVLAIDIFCIALDSCGLYRL